MNLRIMMRRLNKKKFVATVVAIPIDCLSVL